MPRIAVLTCTGTFTESVTTVAGDGCCAVGVCVVVGVCAADVCANADPVPVSMTNTALALSGASDRHIRCRFIMYTSL